MTGARRWQAVKAALFEKECVVVVWKSDLKYIKLIHTGDGEDIRAIYGHIDKELSKWLDNRAKKSAGLGNAPKRRGEVQQ